MRGDLVTEQTDNGFTQDPIACLMSALTKLDLTVRNEIATGLDQFLLRHLGFFNVEPASRGYMIRLRLPACQMRGDQMQAMAEIADTYGPSHAHVTTRGNLQVREIAPKDVLNVMDALTEAGLSCQGSGADSERNLTTSPAAGFDPVELINLAPHTRRNDIAFQAVKVGKDAPVDPGIYCRIGLEGISGHRDLTCETGMVCTHNLMHVSNTQGLRWKRGVCLVIKCAVWGGSRWCMAATTSG
ncbi:hypothetical protein [Ascidiaceihabitans sp.]|uniref:hypothetical protein n=1 Tax=Ascidiaceihabitans sp. TaxID=1872644 RepID=UPI003299D897